MAKYIKELKEKEIILLEEEFLSVSQICKALGVSRQSFYSWMEDKPDFKGSIEDAMSRRNEIMLSMAYSSIKKRLTAGKTVVEKETYIPDERDSSILILKSKTVTKKDYQPDLRTIKMILDRDDKRKSTKECKEEHTVIAFPDTFEENEVK